MSKQRAVVYPYHYSSVDLVRHRNLLSEVQIIGVLSPSGFSLAGYDCSRADDGEKIGILVSPDSQFHEVMAGSEVLIWAEYGLSPDNPFWKICYDKVLCALGMKKKVLCLQKLQPQEVQFFKRYAKLCDAEFQYYEDSYPTYSFTDTWRLSQLETPVIAVMGVSESTSKFALQLSLYEQLQNMGYRVSHIGTKHYCELFGTHSFPKFMFDDTVSSQHKIRWFNQYLKTIEREESPDIILLGIPGGLTMSDDTDYGDLGLLLFETTYQLEPDFTIMTMPWSKPSQEQICSLRKDV